MSCKRFPIARPDALFQRDAPKLGVADEFFSSWHEQRDLVRAAEAICRESAHEIKQGDREFRDFLRILPDLLTSL
jgi:hypothetical protein